VEESEDIRSTAAEDAALESAALQQVLALHPATITLEELARELGGEDTDSFERAVRDLVAAGLLRRSGSLVLPTRAALRFDELLER
jgi:DNA-binding IclR family transcriptional regulator